LPAAFSREDVDGVIRFTWRNQDRFVDSLWGLLSGGATIMMFFGIFGVVTGARTFFQLVGALVVALIGSHIYRASGRTFQLEISERSLTYSTRERGDAAFQVQRALAVEKVSRLQSTYELARAQQERAHQLTFLDDAQSLVALDLPGIRTSDVLKFEAYLQRDLARRGHSVA
jgi:hypothetical protein